MAQWDAWRHRVIQLVEGRGCTRSPLTHAFLWAVAPVKHKNGKIKYVRGVVGSYNCSDLERGPRIAKQQGAREAWYNLD